MSAARLEGLLAALELSPDNGALRLLVAQELREAGRVPEALDQLARLLDDGSLPSGELAPAGRLALEHGRLQLAARCLDAARRAGVMGGTAALEADLKAALVEGGTTRLVEDAADREPSGGAPPDDEDDDGGKVAHRRVASVVDPAEEQVTFADVSGLEDAKRAIHRTIILPFQRPDLYEQYGRRAGGGVMLYGPPGCGKTLLARATAGECGLPFLNVRIEDVLDPHFGVSERLLHDAFGEARERAPCVLFLDELDAFAYSRRKQQGSAGRALVDQLLQELDSIGSDNRGLLVLAATNAPWDVDDALKRPGRFDRVVFVPPPDPAARTRILELALAARPVGDVAPPRLADAAELFSGADLRAVVERAVDEAIEAAIDRGRTVEVEQDALERALERSRPTTLDWLRTARNYVEFANHGGRYDDVVEFLGHNRVKRALKR